MIRFFFLMAIAALFAATAQAASLYREDTYLPLVADHKALHVGDVITVLVYENSSATSSANTRASRDGSVSFTLTSPDRTRNAGMGSGNQLDGRGSTQREGKVLAQITVTVRGVEANGDLLIAGEQLVAINDESQKISVQGKVRPRDVSESNTVQSTRIADARISYLGQGDIADRQRPSWWQRFLLWFGL